MGIFVMHMYFYRWWARLSTGNPRDQVRHCGDDYTVHVFLYHVLRTNVSDHPPRLGYHPQIFMD